jgi:hypothetical protein
MSRTRRSAAEPQAHRVRAAGVSAVVGAVIDYLHPAAASRIRVFSAVTWAPLWRDLRAGSPLVIGDLGTIVRSLIGDLRRVVATVVLTVSLQLAGVHPFLARVVGKAIANFVFGSLAPAERLGRKAQFAGALGAIRAGELQGCAYLVAMAQDTCQSKVERAIVDRGRAPLPEPAKRSGVENGPTLSKPEPAKLPAERKPGHPPSRGRTGGRSAAFPLSQTTSAKPADANRKRTFGPPGLM